MSENADTDPKTKKQEEGPLPTKGLPADWESDLEESELEDTFERDDREKVSQERERKSKEIPPKGLPQNWESELADEEVSFETEKHERERKKREKSEANLPDNFEDDLVSMELKMEGENSAANRKSKGDKKWGRNPNEKKPFFDLSKLELSTSVSDAFGQLKTPTGRKKIVDSTVMEVNSANIMLGKGVTAMGFAKGPTGVAFVPPYLIGFNAYNPYRAPAFGEKTKGAKGRKGSYHRSLAPKTQIPAWVFGRTAPAAKTHGSKPLPPHKVTIVPPQIAAIGKRPGWLKF
jgi:hypothetical protein